ncbi:MAG: hypothetical protein H0W68_13985, partial [Gemmatimonadaceae bacterium]|nr:hypothetical protein [Gemmatimonadaceae bacterium]
MSGFAVIVRRTGAPVLPHELAPFPAPLQARGPDGVERFTSGAVGVVTTLLDTGSPTTRPGVHHAYGLVVAGQVRVDAREALVQQLRAAGRGAAGNAPDVALFAEAWAAWGLDAPERVLGDFSAAIYDEATAELALVRDPFGVRMLYYAITNDLVIASNTLRAVLAAPGVAGDLDDDTLADFIAVGYNEELSTTSFRAVRRVPPGHALVLRRDGTSRLVQHWTLPQPAILRRPRDDEYPEAFREALAAAVSDRARSKSVAVMMSGGIDSTALAALAARAVSPSGVTAVTADSPPGITPEEVPRARKVAASLGIRHVVVGHAAPGFPMDDDGEAFDFPEPVDLPDPGFYRLMFQAMRDASPVGLYGEDPDTLLHPPHLLALLRAMPPWRLAADVVRTLVVHRARPHFGILGAVHDRFRSRHLHDGDLLLAPTFRLRRAARAEARADPTHRTRPRVAAIGNANWQSLLETFDAGVHGVPLE